MVACVGRQEAVEHGLIDGQVVSLHVLEDGGGTGYVPLVTEQCHAGLEGDSVGGNVELLQHGQELGHVDGMTILSVDLNKKGICIQKLFSIVPTFNSAL